MTIYDSTFWKDGGKNEKISKLVKITDKHFPKSLIVGSKRSSDSFFVYPSGDLKDSKSIIEVSDDNTIEVRSTASLNVANELSRAYQQSGEKDLKIRKRYQQN